MLTVNWSIVFVLPSVLSLTPESNNESVFVCATVFFYIYTCTHRSGTKIQFLQKILWEGYFL